MQFSALPEPMLAKSGRLPTIGAWAYEVKWDGFGAIVSTEGTLRVRSRRGWTMTERVRFLEQLPLPAVLDGELVAFGEDGKPDFERVCERMLFRDAEIPLMFIAFDVLTLEGEDVRAQPYRARRQILEELALGGRHRRVPETFEDGEALWQAVCEVREADSEPLLSVAGRELEDVGVGDGARTGVLLELFGRQSGYPGTHDDSPGDRARAGKRHLSQRGRLGWRRSAEVVGFALSIQ